MDIIWITEVFATVVVTLLVLPLLLVDVAVQMIKPGAVAVLADSITGNVAASSAALEPPET